MSVTYYIKHVLLTPLSRSVVLQFLQNAKGIEGRFNYSISELVDRFWEEYEREGTASFECMFVSEEYYNPVLDFYFWKRDEASCVMSVFLESGKVWYEDSPYINYHWYVEKILQITEPYGIGNLETVVYDNYKPPREWLVSVGTLDYLWTSPKYKRLYNPITRSEEDREDIRKDITQLLINLESSGFIYEPIEIEEVASKSNVVHIKIESPFKAEIELREAVIFVKSSEADLHPRDLRPYIRLLNAVAQGTLPQWYFCFNGIDYIDDY